jgi:hypothetical protein
MSFTTINQSANDQALRARVLAAAVQEAWNNPAVADTAFAHDVHLAANNGLLMVWPVAVSSDVEAAYASAVAGGNPDPGGDEAVITDGMIRSAVQADWPMAPSS